jgi:hypothetical protein
MPRAVRNHTRTLHRTCMHDSSSPEAPKLSTGAPVPATPSYGGESTRSVRPDASERSGQRWSCGAQGQRHGSEDGCAVGKLAPNSYAKACARSLRPPAMNERERKIYARCQACVKGTRAWLGPPDLYVPRNPHPLGETPSALLFELPEQPAAMICKPCGLRGSQGCRCWGVGQPDVRPCLPHAAASHWVLPPRVHLHDSARHAWAEERVGGTLCDTSLRLATRSKGASVSTNDHGCRLRVHVGGFAGQQAELG